MGRLATVLAMMLKLVVMISVTMMSVLMLKLKTMLKLFWCEELQRWWKELPNLYSHTFPTPSFLKSSLSLCSNVWHCGEIIFTTQSFLSSLFQLKPHLNFSFLHIIVRLLESLITSTCTLNSIHRWRSFEHFASSRKQTSEIREGWCFGFLPWEKPQESRCRPAWQELVWL